ncbi:cell division protein FtsL [Companilactobacillus allii]|uniref:Cell division protein FtsL n=1 Tax=Companilactobacillus allii TaxID=1847728 RepID=A0A1P8Q5F3_9LACO|nr:cell division protein FtsL [Companilactobacillus allii]APX73055.1 cell division protein FtsL [Companilactobacillus allii]USQ67855.1 cell division protein FtsL [Companilactobacillus allii]
MKESTARNLTDYEAVEQPKFNPAKDPQPARKHKVALSKLEATLIVGLGFLTLALMVSLVSIKVSMTSAQNSLDNITTEITKVNTNNINLRQEISEMTSYDRLSTFAKEHNLKMSNKNVRNVSK